MTSEAVEGLPEASFWFGDIELDMENGTGFNLGLIGSMSL